MIKAVVNIVLGQPLGQASLFQRIFSIVMGSDIKARQKDINALRKVFGNEEMCDKLEAYVYAPRTQQEEVRRICCT